MRKDEDRPKFVARIKKTGKNVIIKCRGDLGAVALIYDIPLELVENLVSSDPPGLGKAYARARSLAIAEESGDKKAVSAVKKKINTKVKIVDDGDRRLKRRNWPSADTDLQKRQKEIRQALLYSLVENEGDIAETSLCLNVPIHEINLMLEKYDDVAAARDCGLRVQAVKAESQAFKQAQQGNTQMLKMVMTNILSDQWSERQQVDVRRVGFAPPSENEAEEVSVLQLVKGDVEDA